MDVEIIQKILQQQKQMRQCRKGFRQIILSGLKILVNLMKIL